jgi:hypothetical protein
MGAGASIPEHLDLETAKTLAGDRFDEEKFNALAVDGKITRQQLEEAAASVDTVAAEGSTEGTNEMSVPGKNKEDAQAASEPSPAEDAAKAVEAAETNAKEEENPEDVEEHDEEDALIKGKDTGTENETEAAKDARLWEEFEKNTPGLCCELSRLSFHAS